MGMQVTTRIDSSAGVKYGIALELSLILTISLLSRIHQLHSFLKLLNHIRCGFLRREFTCPHGTNIVRMDRPKLSHF